MRLSRTTTIALACVATLAFSSRHAAAFSLPALDLTTGQSFSSNGTPSTGGLAVAFSPLWHAGDRTQFGATVFADDIGNTTQELFHLGSSIGTVASVHRMTWGLAWRADQDVIQRKRWAAGLTGLAGWWRVQDDVRGEQTRSASAIGFGLGAGVRRFVSPRHEVGLMARWQELTADRHSAFRRVDHYATAAIEWRWHVETNSAER